MHVESQLLEYGCSQSMVGKDIVLPARKQAVNNTG